MTLPIAHRGCSLETGSVVLEGGGAALSADEEIRRASRGAGGPERRPVSP